MLRTRRWQIVLLLFSGGLINYMDRGALAIAAPVMTKDLGLGPAALGVIFSAFFIGYALFNFIGGYVSDYINPHRVFALAMGVWSLFCALTGAAVGFTSLLVIRVLFGIGEGPFCATANKLVNNWFPRREVGSALGVANGGTPLGGAIAGPIVGTCLIAFGWRFAFVIVGAIGLVWLVL
jgi:ACS family hexuronate transporter-like MFS transporter